MSSDYLYMAPKEGIWWYDGKHWHGKPMGFRIIYEITQTKTFMLVMVLTLLPPLYHLWTLRDGRPAPANVFHVAAIGGAILLYTLGFSNFFLAENVDGQVLGTANLIVLLAQSFRVSMLNSRAQQLAVLPASSASSPSPSKHGSSCFGSSSPARSPGHSRSDSCTASYSGLQELSGSPLVSTTQSVTFNTTQGEGAAAGPATLALPVSLTRGGRESNE